MKTKVTRVEKGISLVVDEPLLEELGLDDGTEVELSRNGDSLVLTPVRPQLREILDEMDEQYGSVFRRLAE